MRRTKLPVAILLLASVLAVRPARSDEGDVDAGGSAEWLRALSGLRARHAPLDAEALAALDRQLPSFDPEALEARASSHEVNQLPDERGVLVRHALRSLAYYRKIGAHLERGPQICLLLGSANETEWSRALLELCREPFGERLGAVADRLSVDTRGPMRMMAGRIAVFLNAFCGGSGSAWGAATRSAWDPTPLVRRIAERLLNDRNPAVACVFATYDAYSLEDKEVVNRMVAHLADERQTPRVSRGLLWNPEQTVGEACRFALDAQFIFYRTERHPFPGETLEPPLRRVVSRPSAGKAEAIARWWNEVRKDWSFIPDGEAWERVLDHALVVRPGEAVVVNTPRGAVTIRLSQYEEHVTADSPELSIHLEVDQAELIHSDVGNPSHHLGYVSSGMATCGVGWAASSGMFAPATKDGVRMRVRLYVAPSAR